jgi:hypothetical protein
MNPRRTALLPRLAAATLAIQGLAFAQAPTLTATIRFLDPKAMDSIVNANNGQRNLLIGGGGIVEIRSGATGALLGTLVAGPVGSGFGNAVAAVGDQDGDGQEDILVGAPFSTGNGQAFLFSGSRGAGYPLLSTINPLPANVGGNTAMAFGWSVARLDNLDGTGSQEFAVGAPRWEPSPGLTRIGLVEIVSSTSPGTSPVTLRTLFGSTMLEEFGYSIATLHILPGGTGTIASFAVGSPSPQNFFNDPGAVSVFSGLILSLTQAQALISNFNYPTRFDMGTCLAATDVNGDNEEDVLTGLPDVGNFILARSAYVRFGAGFTTGQVVGTTVSQLNTGWSVSECGAFDANAGNEMLVGAPDASGSPTPVAGHAFILSTAGLVHDVLAPVSPSAPTGDPSFGKVVSEIDTSILRFAVAAPATGRVYIFN